MVIRNGVKILEEFFWKGFNGEKEDNEVPL